MAQVEDAGPTADNVVAGILKELGILPDSFENYITPHARHIMAKAIVSFIFVFLFSFVLGGWFLMPYLPPVPDHPVSVVDWEYWQTNWAGAVLGILLGGGSAWSILRSARKKGSPEGSGGAGANGAA